MAVNQTISTFISTASKRDFQRDNLYRIISLKCEGLTLDTEDIMYCKGIKIPGRENPHSAVKYMGMEFYYPQSTVKFSDISDLSITTIIDSQSITMGKLERASRILFNDLTTSGNWRFPSTADTLTVAVLDFNLNVQETITYYGVSFKGFDGVDAKPAEGEGVAQEVTMHFTFFYYKRTGSDTVYTAE